MLLPTVTAAQAVGAVGTVASESDAGGVRRSARQRVATHHAPDEGYGMLDDPSESNAPLPPDDVGFEIGTTDDPLPVPDRLSTIFEKVCREFSFFLFYSSYIIVH